MNPRASMGIPAACLLLACSGSSDSKDAPNAPQETPDQTSFQATWKPETLVLGEATVRDKLRNPEASDGSYEFDPSLTSVASLAPGQPLLLTGVDLVKVDSVEVRPDTVIVKTEPALLTDAVSDATLAWDVAADMASAIRTAPQFASTTHLAAAPQFPCDTQINPNGCQPKTTFSGKLGNLDASQAMVLNPDGSLKMDLTIKFPQQGTAVLSVAASAVLKGFRQQGNVQIRSGALGQGSIGVSGLDLDLDLNVGAVAMGQSDDTFKYPIEVTFPYALGPLPAYFKLSATISLNPVLSESSSARSHVHFHVGGSLGLALNGTNLVGMGGLKSLDGDAPKLEEVETVSPVAGGFGVLVEFPKITFGIGAAKVAATEGYLSGKEEVVINSSVVLGALGLIDGTCTTVSANVGAYAGGAIRLLGKSFSQEKQLSGVTREVSKKGNPSMSMCQ